MIKTSTVGTVTLHVLPDEIISLNGNHALYPSKRRDWSPYLAPNKNDQIRVVVSALLIDDGTRLTLVDTGFGDAHPLDREESIYKSLDTLNITPEQVERVIITHAHGDHCGGNTVLRDGARQPYFPNATYVLQEKDFQPTKGTMDLWKKQLKPLADAGQLHLIDGDTQLDDTLTCLSTPGHTIGHQSVLIQSEGESAIFLGDLAIFSDSLAHPEWGPNWAWSREEDIKSRKRIITFAAEHNSSLILGHDADHTFVKVSKAEDSFRVSKVNVAATGV